MGSTLKDSIPDSIFNSISRHLIKSAHRAEDGYLSNEEEEDSITGDLFRSLRKGWVQPATINNESWKWRVTTRKFRGKGELATEAIFGADGIIQIEIDGKQGSVIRKGMLFQAKKGWKYRNQKLVEQVAKMEEFAPESSAVFDYRPDGYRAFVGRVVLQSHGRPDLTIQQRRLGEFLADVFLACMVGRADTYYDWDRQTLIFAGQQPTFGEVPISVHPKYLAAIEVERE
jgi:hypothetical protein